MVENIEKSQKIEKIKNGTVIDHIKAGKALIVLKILGVDGSNGELITMGINVKSSKAGKKDIIKFENVFLNEHDVNKIALISPSSTINIIKDTQVVEKFTVEPPARVDFVKCPNQNCISNQGEPVNPTFDVISKTPLKVQCAYCDRILYGDEVMAFTF
ncbi:MAG: aspartate carbamoyltransferase regulatory subunit [Promethearchaeota archaeon CR_4]|nr:MAG: aspartate carbamoyltransferase regulatory subunit [Candidatus Lokiarchaeota archaeon CR_4]